jgi:hypothetical protein
MTRKLHKDKGFGLFVHHSILTVKNNALACKGIQFLGKEGKERGRKKRGDQREGEGGREEGKERGRKEGRKEGRREGRKKGRKGREGKRERDRKRKKDMGRENGRREGERENLASQGGELGRYNEETTWQLRQEQQTPAMQAEKKVARSTSG